MRWFPFLALFLAGCPGGDSDGSPSDDDTAVPGSACAEPVLRVPWTAEGATPRLPRARTDSRFERRPVHIEVVGDATIEIRATGGLTVAGEDGRVLDLPLRRSAADGALPATLLVGATHRGELSVQDVSDGRSCAPVKVPFEVVSTLDLAVRTLGDFPYVHPVALFRDDETVDLAVDPTLWGDRVGFEADVYVVPHRDAEAWAADPTLVDVTGAVERIVVGETQEGGLPIWDADLAEPGARPYDVVLDFGLDGRLDPGDLIDGLAGPGFWRAGDLSADGPYTPATRRLAALNGLEVWWPSDLDPAVSGPVPLVMIGHGNGHDYRWYGFLGSHLASHGFVVVSHFNNTGPGIATAAASTLEATEWVRSRRDTMLDGALAGLIDPHRIAWVGHSRGGEGVVYALQRLAGNVGKHPDVSYGVDDIRAIVSIAPTVFQGVRQSNPGTVPYLTLVGGADGDVTGGANCGQCQSMRIPAAALGITSIVNVQGASHNVFHDGGSFPDDGTGPDLLTHAQVHPAERAWLLAWLSWHLLGIDGYADVFGSLPTAFRPRGVPDEVVHTVTLRPALDGPGLALDHFQLETDTDVCSAGGPVVALGLDDLTEGRLDDRDALFEWRESDPMNGMTLVSGVGAERGAILGWTGDASWTATFPEPVDVTGYRTLTLTVARQTRHPDDPPGDLAFAVELLDADGDASLLRLDAFGTLPPLYQRGGLGRGKGWAAEWQTVRLPLQSFVAGGRPVDLDRIAGVRLRFGPDHGAATGRIALDDVGFVP